MQTIVLYNQNTNSCSENMFVKLQLADTKEEDTIMMKDSYYTRSIEKREKRKKQVRRNIILIVLSTLIISAFLVFFNSMSIQASDKDHTVSYKYFKSIYISQGDTLWSIAKENMDEHYESTHEYINEVKHMNSLTSNQIVCGSYLIIPYFSTEYKISDL